MYIAPHPVPTVSAHAASVIQERALGVGGEESSSSSNVLAESTSSTATTTSNGPFFTSGSIGGGSNSDNGGQTDVTKTALEWVFAIAALLAIASIATWRYAQVRRRHSGIRSMIPLPRGSRSDFSAGTEGIQERRRSLPRTTGLPRPGSISSEPLPASMGSTLFYPPSISHGRYPILLEPAAAHLAGGRRGRSRGASRRAAQGADIDAQGRRGGRRDSDDLDGDDKDELPAYESAAVGSPPRYGDEDLHYIGGMQMHIISMPIPESTEREREVAIEQALQRLPSEDSISSENLASQEHNRVDGAFDNHPQTAATSASNMHLPQNPHPC